MEFEKRFVSHRGVTVIQKRDPKLQPLDVGKVALVLAGGGFSGGAYKAGGLRAMDEFFGRRTVSGAASTPFSLRDFDLFIGLSAGSLLATFMAGGMRPDALVDLLSDGGRGNEHFRSWQLMWPNVGEMPRRLLSFLEKEQEILTHYLSGATSSHTGRRSSLSQTLGKMMTASARLLPTGLFDSRRFEASIERILARAGIPTSFEVLQRQTEKALYMTATDLNRGRLVVFGHDEPYASTPIPQAIAASCALPVWYRPVRIQNPRAGVAGEPDTLDLVDGSLLRTANIRLAVEKGATLVICYNPLTHIVYDRAGRSLYEHGTYAIASQVVRILIGARLHTAKELIYSSDDFPCDVVFVEPASDDYDFFRMNPLNFWTADRAATHGYRSVRDALEENRSLLGDLFRSHGIELGGHHPAGQGEPDAQPVDLRESQGETPGS